MQIAVPPCCLKHHQRAGGVGGMTGDGVGHAARHTAQCCEVDDGVGPSKGLVERAVVKDRSLDKRDIKAVKVRAKAVGQVVDDRNAVDAVSCQQSLAQICSDKSGTTGHCHAHNR